MSDRTTRRDAERCFQRFAKFMGKSTDCHRKVNGRWRSRVGCWQFDYNPIYGGARIQEIINKEGGVDLPFGDRMPPREFCRALNLMARASEIKCRSKARRKRR